MEGCATVLNSGKRFTHMFSVHGVVEEDFQFMNKKPDCAFRDAILAADMYVKNTTYGVKKRSCNMLVK